MPDSTVKLSESQPKTPLFVTFYSYKGGVGRTMALLNAASILAGRGRRVLMIDFDLEAPGLSFLAQRQMGADSEKWLGLVDLISDVLENPEDNALASEERKSEYKGRYTVSLPIPEHVRKLEGGCLDLMPCGALGSDYEDRLYKLDFSALYLSGVGKPLFEHFRNVVRLSGEYDYILIDSRTGLSDEGGICTRELADDIVLVTGLNRQNVDGTVRYLLRAKAAGIDLQSVRLLISPVPVGYEELREEREQELRSRIEQEVGLKFGTLLRISYHPRLALDEEPFVYRWSDTELFASYQDVATLVLGLANDTPGATANRLMEAVQKQEFDEALRLARRLLAEDRQLGRPILQLIADPLIESVPGLLEHASAFAEILIQDQADDHEALFHWGNALSDQAKAKQGAEADRLLAEACEKFASALKIKPDFHEALNNWGAALIAQAKTKQGPEAERILAEAEEKCLQSEGIQPGGGSYNLACVYSLRGDEDTCREWLLKAQSQGKLPSRQHLESDTDLDNVRQSDWFKALLSEL